MVVGVIVVLVVLVVVVVVVGDIVVVFVVKIVVVTKICHLKNSPYQTEIILFKYFDYSYLMPRF